MKKLMAILATLLLLVTPMVFAAGPDGAVTVSNPTVCSATFVSGAADECGAKTNPVVASQLIVTLGTLTTTPTANPVGITITGTTVEGPATEVVTFAAGAVSTNTKTTVNHFTAVTSVDVTAGESELATTVDTYTVTVGASEKSDVAGAVVAATGGQIKQLNVAGEASTYNWQGFVGKVSGTIVLEDAAQQNMNTWTVAPGSVNGNIYFGTSAAIDWSTIAGDTAATYATAEDTALVMTGQTDSVANTFSNTAGTGLSIGGAAAVDTLGKVVGNWEEFLYKDTTNTQYLYSTQIKSASTALYDGSAVTDGFQLVVPTGNGVRSNYYVYIELI